MSRRKKLRITPEGKKYIKVEDGCVTWYTYPAGHTRSRNRRRHVRMAESVLRVLYRFYCESYRPDLTDSARRFAAVLARSMRRK